MFPLYIGESFDRVVHALHHHGSTKDGIRSVNLILPKSEFEFSQNSVQNSLLFFISEKIKTKHISLDVQAISGGFSVSVAVDRESFSKYIEKRNHSLSQSINEVAFFFFGGHVKDTFHRRKALLVLTLAVLPIYIMLAILAINSF